MLVVKVDEQMVVFVERRGWGRWWAGYRRRAGNGLGGFVDGHGGRTDVEWKLISTGNKLNKLPKAVTRLRAQPRVFRKLMAVQSGLFRPLER